MNKSIRHLVLVRKWLPQKQIYSLIEPIGWSHSQFMRTPPIELWGHESDWTTLEPDGATIP